MKAYKLKQVIIDINENDEYFAKDEKWRNC